LTDWIAEQQVLGPATIDFDAVARDATSSAVLAATRASLGIDDGDEAPTAQGVAAGSSIDIGGVTIEITADSARRLVDIIGTGTDRSQVERTVATLAEQLVIFENGHDEAAEQERKADRVAELDAKIEEQERDLATWKSTCAPGGCTVESQFIAIIERTLADLRERRAGVVQDSATPPRRFSLGVPRVEARPKS
jgi:hypothetical protein